MFKTPTSLSLDVRKRVIAALDDVLQDGLSLQLLFYFAHWNVKGAGFAALHPFFGTLSDAIGAYNDRIAERIVILGGTAKVKTVPITHGDDQGEKALVKVVSTGVQEYLECLEGAREKVKDDEDTDQILIDGCLDWTKYGWQLIATLGD